MASFSLSVFSGSFIMTDDSVIWNRPEILMNFPVDWSKLLQSAGIEEAFWSPEYGDKKQPEVLVFEASTEQVDLLREQVKKNNGWFLRIAPMDWDAIQKRPLNGEPLRYEWESEALKL